MANVRGMAAQQSLKIFQRDFDSPPTEGCRRCYCETGRVAISSAIICAAGLDLCQILSADFNSEIILARAVAFDNFSISQIIFWQFAARPNNSG